MDNVQPDEDFQQKLVKNVLKWKKIQACGGNSNNRKYNESD